MSGQSFWEWAADFWLGVLGSIGMMLFIALCIALTIPTLGYSIRVLERWVKG